MKWIKEKNHKTQFCLKQDNIASHFLKYTNHNDGIEWRSKLIHWSKLEHACDGSSALCSLLIQIFRAVFLSVVLEQSLLSPEFSGSEKRGDLGQKDLALLTYCVKVAGIKHLHLARSTFHLQNFCWSCSWHVHLPFLTSFICSFHLSSRYFLTHSRSPFICFLFRHYWPYRVSILAALV